VFVYVLVLQLSTPLGLFYPIHQPLIVIGGLWGRIEVDGVGKTRGTGNVKGKL